MRTRKQSTSPFFSIPSALLSPSPRSPLRRHHGPPALHALPHAAAGSLRLLHRAHPRPLTVPHHSLRIHHRLPPPRPLRVPSRRPGGCGLPVAARRRARDDGVRDLLPQLLHLPSQVRAVRGGHLRARALAPPRARPDDALRRRQEGGRDRNGPRGVVRARLEPEHHRLLRGHGRRGVHQVAHLPPHWPRPRQVQGRRRWQWRCRPGGGGRRRREGRRVGLSAGEETFRLLLRIKGP